MNYSIYLTQDLNCCLSKCVLGPLCYNLIRTLDTTLLTPRPNYINDMKDIMGKKDEILKTIILYKKGQRFRDILV